MPMQKKGWRERVEQDGGVLPITGFPRVATTTNGKRAKSNRTRRKHEHFIQHAFVHGRRLGVIPSKRAFTE